MKKIYEIWYDIKHYDVEDVLLASGEVQPVEDEYTPYY